MAISPAEVDQLVETELSRIDDLALLARTRDLRVAPTPVLRDWDYGAPDEAFVCWTVVQNEVVNRGVAYCEDGFGPHRPWGLVFLRGAYMSIGMDSGWFPTLEEAMRDLIGWDEQPLD